MKTILKAAIVLLLIVPFLTATSFALEYFDVSRPSIKKASIYVSTDSNSSLNRQFVAQLKNMLQASLLFENVSSKRSADYSIQLGSKIESKDVLITIEGEKQSTYKAKRFGIRFKSTDDAYLGRKTAQMANRIIKEFFGIEGSIGSSLAWSVTEGNRKVIYKKSFAIDDTTQQVTYNFYSNYGASWNKEKDHIVYTSHTDSGTVINIQQVEPLVFGANAVFRRSGQASSPIWAPDDTIYLTLHVSDQNSDIFQFRINGELGPDQSPSLNQIRQLTHIPSIETEPTLSPDNRLMAYVSDTTSEPQIYMLDLRTQKSKRITHKGGYNVSPSFSPNGKYLAFRALREGVSAIFRIDLASGEERQLTPDEIQAEDPGWSPDGSLIVFAGRANKNNVTKIYYTLSSGGNYQRLTDTGPDVVESNPTWGPALR